MKLGLGFGIFGVADFEFNIVTVIGSSLDALKEAPRIKLNKNIMVAFESDVSVMFHWNFVSILKRMKVILKRNRTKRNSVM